MEMDIALYDKCSRENNEKIKAREAEREHSSVKWNLLVSAAQAKGVDVKTLLN